MKIGIFHIIVAHFGTLRNHSTGRISVVDLLWFILLPTMIGILVVFTDLKLDKDFYNVSITFYGIFIALLLNIQVAIFSVFQRNWNLSNDDILNAYQVEKLAQKKQLLRQLNINVSYLIVLSCIYLSISAICFGFKAENIYCTIMSTILFVHFLLTLIMTVKRTFVLFQGEYDIG